MDIPSPPNDAALPAEDLFALHDLLARYGHIMDERAWGQFVNIFSPDCTYDASDFGFAIWHGLDELIAGMQASKQHPVAHHSTNVIVGAPEHDGRVRLLSKALGVGPKGRVGSAVYEDIAVRTAAGWRLTYRRATLRRAAPGRSP